MQKEIAEMRWRDVTSETPPAVKDLLCFCSDNPCPSGNFVIAAIRDGLWEDGFHSGSHNITHWMPLPEPPKEE